MGEVTKKRTGQGKFLLGGLLIVAAIVYLIALDRRGDCVSDCFLDSGRRAILFDD
jgi:hypothetical protein